MPGVAARLIQPTIIWAVSGVPSATSNRASLVVASCSYPVMLSLSPAALSASAIATSIWADVSSTPNGARSCAWSDIWPIDTAFLLDAAGREHAGVDPIGQDAGSSPFLANRLTHPQPSHSRRRRGRTAARPGFRFKQFRRKRHDLERLRRHFDDNNIRAAGGSNVGATRSIRTWNPSFIAPTSRPANRGPFFVPTNRSCGIQRGQRCPELGQTLTATEDGQAAGGTTRAPDVHTSEWTWPTTTRRHEGRTLQRGGRMGSGHAEEDHPSPAAGAAMTTRSLWMTRSFRGPLRPGPIVQVRARRTPRGVSSALPGLRPGYRRWLQPSPGRRWWRAVPARPVWPR